MDIFFYQSKHRRTVYYDLGYSLEVGLSLNQLFWWILWVLKNLSPSQLVPLTSPAPTLSNSMCSSSSLVLSQ